MQIKSMRRLLSLAVAIGSAFTPGLNAQTKRGPDTVTVRSGGLTLRGLVWRPNGRGPFPGVLFNHGAYSTGDPMPMSQPDSLGPVFARHGYAFLFLFRRGTGLSAKQGAPVGDLMAQAFATRGQAGRNAIQVDLMEHEELNEVIAALAFLRRLPYVDARRVGVVGHSFGGALTILLAARDTTIRAAVTFGAAAYSWEKSPELRARLSTAVRHAGSPIFFIHAANDYSTEPGTELAGEMRKSRKPNQLKIYAEAGRTPREGHNLVYRNVRMWESDVFAFLDNLVKSHL